MPRKPVARTSARRRNPAYSEADYARALAGDKYLTGATLQGANLEGVDLRGVDLTGADLQDTDLIGADLTNVNLQGANLKGANLKGANLYGANLTGADLKNATLAEANLKGANLTGTSLYGENLQDANLTRADLTGVDLRHANLRHANLRGANLTNANLTGATLERANLEDAILVDAILEGAKLEGANLKNANLFGVNLEGANLKRANLEDADITGADLARANLTLAILEDAHLVDANLFGADLQRANLKGANLKSATLTVANLSGANLYRANLYGAILVDANLKGANLEDANLQDADLEGTNLEGANLEGTLLVKPVATRTARSYGRQTGAVLKMGKPDAPAKAAEFKRRYPAEFDRLKADTQGRDFSEPLRAQVRQKYATPFEWLVTEGTYDSTTQRLCPDPNLVYKFNLDLTDPAFTKQQRAFLTRLANISRKSGHPYEWSGLFTVGWVRLCVNDAAETWLVEEIQSDVGIVRTKLKDGSAPAGLEGYEDVIVELRPYIDRFYEDALGIVFMEAEKKGYGVEMLEYEAKREFKSPRGIYEDLPKSMGMQKRPKSAVLGEQVAEAWFYKPNPRKRR